MPGALRSAPVCFISRRGEADIATSDLLYAGRSMEELQRIVGDFIADRKPPQPDTDARYTPHGNRADWRIDPYKDHREFGDRTYRAVRDYLHAFAAPIRGKDVRQHPRLARLDPSGLLGMGGAGVPAYRKWLDVWQADGDEKYVVCNGDESEPGTFKDREILLRMPHLVVEGVILAGLMTNATAGYIYIRHEYGEQIAAVRAEIDRAIGMRACGSNIFGSGRAFTVEVFVSPGGYICGEQSALLEAMEDRRAQPRNRPPELATNGLRDRPTLVNNVETLAWAPAILLRHDALAEETTRKLLLQELTAAAEAKIASAVDDKAKERASRELKDAPIEAARRAAIGASWYAAQGRPGFRGRRLLSISGDLERPGVYEVSDRLDTWRVDRSRWRREGWPAAGSCRSIRAIWRIASRTSARRAGFRGLVADPTGGDSCRAMAYLGRDRSRGHRGRRGHVRPSHVATRLAACPSDRSGPGNAGRDHARRWPCGLRGGPRLPRPRSELHRVLPQRIVWQVRAMPTRLAETRRARNSTHIGTESIRLLPERMYSIWDTLWA